MCVFELRSQSFGFGPNTLSPPFLLATETVPHREEIPLTFQVHLPHIGLLLSSIEVKEQFEVKV